MKTLITILIFLSATFTYAQEPWKKEQIMATKELADKKILLIKVDGEQAEYWEGSSSKIVIAFNIARSIATGKQYNQGEHGKVNM